MNILLLSPDELKSEISERACPYNDVNICKASITSFRLDEQKKKDCCGTEDYDGCPMFLSKLLRTR